MPWFRRPEEKAPPASPATDPPVSAAGTPLGSAVLAATGSSSSAGNRFRIQSSIGTPAIGTIVSGEVITGSVRRGMSMRLQSGDNGAVRPAPIEIVKITRHQSAKVILYKGQNVEAPEEATPATGVVGMKLKGVQWTELKPGDLLLG